ncbi:MAG: glycosyltransferase [Thiopseudomonas sp.]
MKKIFVVGGIPNPIGGVTSFISRLADRNMVDCVIDIYPGSIKRVPDNYKGQVFFKKGVFFFYISYLFGFFGFYNRVFHFNFSRPKSLFLFLLMPKYKNKFHLTLHHGDLRFNDLSFVEKIIYRLSLRKFDCLYSLSDIQRCFYISMGVNENRINLTSSYVPPVKSSNKNITNFKGSPVDEFVFGKELVFVSSGYPSDFYNHDWCIEVLKEYPEAKLIVFLYGSGNKNDYYESLIDSDDLKVIWDASQEYFNFILSKCDVYLRPSSKDSFGIAVADAINFGLVALASDVCKRYPGAYLFENNNYEAFKLSVKYIIEGNYEELRKESTSYFEEFRYKVE